MPEKEKKKSKSSEERKLKRYAKYNKKLKKYFGHDELKPEQAEIIDHIIHKKGDALCVLATGFGKSLLFQLPAMIEKKCVFVISPLVSLIADQIMQMEKLNIKACCLNGTNKNKTQTLKEIEQNKYNLVYVTPEYFIHCETIIKNMVGSNSLLMLCVDESHCCSTFGQDFRPTYKALGVFRDWVPSGVPILCVTATATGKVRNDIRIIMKLKNELSIIGSFDRPNLYISVNKKTNIADDVRPLLEKYKGEKTIIYVRTRDNVDKIVKEVTKLKIKVNGYHAGMADNVKTLAQEEFTKGDTCVIVATCAFSMGINLSNIRLIIHYGSPQNIENYFQEVGRAGRDTKDSYCYTFYDTKDFMVSSMQIAEIKNKAYRDYQEQAKRDMEKYIYTRDCRRVVLLKYFNEDSTKVLQPCKNCDNCKYAKKLSDFTYPCYLLLSLIKSHDDRSGAGVLIETLRGAKSKKVPDYLKSNIAYSRGTFYSADKWKDLINILITNDYLKQKQINKYGGAVIHITQLTKDWLTQIDQSYDDITSTTKFADADKLMFTYDEPADEIPQDDSDDESDKKPKIKNTKLETNPIVENKGKKWTDDEDAQLISELKELQSTHKIAEVHKRTRGSIIARLENIIKKYHAGKKSVSDIHDLTGLREEFIIYSLRDDESDNFIFDKLYKKSSSSKSKTK